jgi:hypothetical protein
MEKKTKKETRRNQVTGKEEKSVEWRYIPENVILNNHRCDNLNRIPLSR